MVVALSCSKDVAIPGGPIPPPPPPPPPPRVILVEIGSWEKVGQDLYLNDHPGFFQYSELTGKRISVYATVNYGSYSVDQIISTGPMPYDNGSLWASISGNDLKLYWRADDVPKLPSFTNITVRAVIE